MTLFRRDAVTDPQTKQASVRPVSTETVCATLHNFAPGPYSFFPAASPSVERCPILLVNG